LARNFLERGLPGIPAYEFVGEFVALLIYVKRRGHFGGGLELDAPKTEEALGILRSQNRQFQFAECWDAREVADLADLGLRAANFHCVRDAGDVAAIAAIWDQRTFKQTVIRGYAPGLALARPLINFNSWLLGMPLLPRVGSTLAHGFVCHLAVEPGKSKALLKLISRLLAGAKGGGMEFLTLGLAANDPRLALVRGEFWCREYRSRIYMVKWPRLGGSGRELDGRYLGPEVALL
jgi:hypothetical protein